MLHPSLNTDAFDKGLRGSLALKASTTPPGTNWLFSSLNRYERKKNHKLAILALGIGFGCAGMK